MLRDRKALHNFFIMLHDSHTSAIIYAWEEDDILNEIIERLPYK